MLTPSSPPYTPPFITRLTAKYRDQPLDIKAIIQDQLECLLNTRMKNADKGQQTHNPTLHHYGLPTHHHCSSTRAEDVHVFVSIIRDKIKDYLPHVIIISLSVFEHNTQQLTLNLALSLAHDPSGVTEHYTSHINLSSRAVRITHQSVYSQSDEDIC